MPKITFTHTTSGDFEHEHELPARFEVCSGCDGHGSRLNRAIGEHAYSREEFAREFDDEEQAQYFTRGGRYDVECDECHGARVVPVVDEDEARRTLRGRRLLALYEAVTNERANYAAECAAERRMGA